VTLGKCLTCNHHRDITTLELALSDVVSRSGLGEKTMAATQIDRPLATSIAQASRLTSLSRATIRGYIRNGRLRTVRCGRRVIVPFDSLQDLVRRGASDGKEGTL
jgi:excisionase family DNA binding protein